MSKCPYRLKRRTQNVTKRTSAKHFTRDGGQKDLLFDVLVNIIEQDGWQRGARGIDMTQGCKLVVFPGPIHFLQHESTAEAGSSRFWTNR